MIPYETRRCAPNCEAKRCAPTRRARGLRNGRRGALRSPRVRRNSKKSVTTRAIAPRCIIFEAIFDTLSKRFFWSFAHWIWRGAAALLRARRNSRRSATTRAVPLRCLVSRQSQNYRPLNFVKSCFSIEVKSNGTVNFTDSKTQPFHERSPSPWQQRSPSLSRGWRPPLRRRQALPGLLSRPLLARA